MKKILCNATLVATLVLALGACGSATSPPPASTPDGGASAGPQEAALRDVKAYIGANLDALVTAAGDLQKAAPAPDADGWSAATDRAAVDAMKAAWVKGRQAYEHVEGAIAVLFEELDISTDERYDGFLEAKADDNLFDGTGVTGIHAVERILWSDTIPAAVVDFERALTGYRPAAFPKTMQEADDFKNGLCARLVTDVTMMRDMFKPLALDTAAAYRGVIGSLGEQIEKVTKAETGEEESRYAGTTLGDMRFNVEGGVATQAAFRTWLLASPGGAALDPKIAAGFERITDAYGTTETKLPPIPADWNATMPSAADLATPFGKLYQVLSTESDDKNPDSLVSTMNAAAMAMGIKTLP